MSAFVGLVGPLCRRCQPCDGIPDLDCQLVGNIHRFRTGVLPIVFDLDQPSCIALDTEDVNGLGAICDRLKLIAIEGPFIVLAGLAAGKKSESESPFRYCGHPSASSSAMN